MSTQYGIELGKTASQLNPRPEIVSIGGTIPTLAVPWTSAHSLAGQDNWWDEIGVVDIGGVSYYTNPNPDQGAGAQPNNSGARGCALYNTEFTDVSVEVIWPGVYASGQSGPVVCINPDEDAFGLCLYLEDFGGQWVHTLWDLGRKPNDLRPAAVAFADAHTSGDPVVLRMDVVGNNLKCYQDGVLLTLNNAVTGLPSDTYPIPSELAGSTVHGVSIDVNKNGPQVPNGATPEEIENFPYNRTGNLPAGVYPFTIMEL
jgi:hypothetical protein